MSFARRAAQIVNRVMKVQVTNENSLMSKHMHDVESLKNALRSTGGGASTEELDEERRTLVSILSEGERASRIMESTVD